MDDNLFDDLPLDDAAAGGGSGGSGGVPAAGSVSSRLPWRYAGPGRARFPMVASGAAARRAAKAGANGGKGRRGLDIDDHIRHAVREESAATLGRAGSLLQEAVAALSEFDRECAAGDTARDRVAPVAAAGAEVGASVGASAERRALLVAAAAALWQYVVQREAMGLTNHDALEHVYGVTRELWGLMGSAEVVCRKCGQ
jgi:hypothetical protein